MKWKGETIEQRIDRITQWHRVFCWLPTQMRNGNWVWLEGCWARWSGNYSPARWEYSDSLTAPEDIRPATPPPSPRKK